MLLTRVDPDRARQDARQILTDRRFHHAPAPRPLRRPLEWIGDRFRTVSNAIGDVLRAVPGPTWLAVAVVAVAVAIAVIVLITRGRVHAIAAGGATARERAAAREDPVALEQAADAAERAGDFDRALRLRFRAGLLRLDARGAIRYRPSLTVGEVRRLLGSETFDELAARFEEVAYGGVGAQPGDVDVARREWPRVVHEATKTW